MRTIGWIFLSAYGLDAVLSALASYRPDFLPVSNLVSTVMIIFTIIAFILACIGKLRPGVVFILLSGYYFLMLGFGILLATLVMSEIGPQQAQKLEITPTYYREHYSWFQPVHLGMLLAWCALTVFGLVMYGKSQSDDNPNAPVDAP